MASIEVKNFAKDADEVNTPNNARVETVNVGGQRVMKIHTYWDGTGLMGIWYILIILKNYKLLINYGKI